MSENTTLHLKDNLHILADNDIFPTPDYQIFSPEYWQQLNAVTGQATGRGSARFIKHNHLDMVLRHYYRGGLVSKISRDLFLYFGKQHTRSMAEFELLQKMREKGLPVPRPIAAGFIKKGLFHKDDIIIERIPEAKDVHTHLLEAPISSDNWEKIGRTIRLFHDNGIYHHDLNIHNILLDSNQQVWLIDFDKCGERQGNAWKKDNIDRLLRSLRKEKTKHHIQWEESDFVNLLRGYS